MLRRHFFFRDMVEAFELTVPYLRATSRRATDENLADFLTKPYKSAPKFFEMRSKIMNEPASGPRTWRLTFARHRDTILNVKAIPKDKVVEENVEGSWS